MLIWVRIIPVKVDRSLTAIIRTYIIISVSFVERSSNWSSMIFGKSSQTSWSAENAEKFNCCGYFVDIPTHNLLKLRDITLLAQVLIFLSWTNCTKNFWIKESNKKLEAWILLTRFQSKPLVICSIIHFFYAHLTENIAVWLRILY